MGWLAQCDAMVLTDGWQMSPGTAQEIRYCLTFGIPVYENIYNLRHDVPMSKKDMQTAIKRHSDTPRKAGKK